MVTMFDEAKVRNEIDDMVKRHHWQSEWRTFVHSIKRVGVCFREMMRRWPGLLFLLCEMVPVRKWYTWGPNGGGPWMDSLHDAAEFIARESATDVEESGEGTVVIYGDLEVRRLRWPGQKIERDGWGIQCILIPRYQLGREWNGW